MTVSTSVPAHAASTGIVKARMDRDEYALKAVLRNLSRFCACRATDKTLAEKLGWNERRVQRVLGRLAHQEDVEAVTTPPERREGGKTNRFSDEVACGQLLCTPSQFKEWLAAACEAGYVKSWQDDGKRVIDRIGHFPAVELPNRYCEEKWVAPSPLQDPRAKIVELVTSKRRVTDFGTFVLPTANAELAKCIGGSVSCAKKLTKALVDDGQLFSWMKDGRRRLSTVPPPDTACTAPSPTDPRVSTILQVLADGPHPAAEVAAALRLSPLPAFIIRKARSSGVKVTRFGHPRELSLGPLPSECMEGVRHRQRQAGVDPIPWRVNGLRLQAASRWCFLS